METRQNPIVNRLNKTKVEREVDHEQEKVEREKKAAAERRIAAAAKVCIPESWLHKSMPLQKKADLELARAREAEKAARSYDTFLNVDEYEEEVDENAPKKSVRELEEDFM